MASVEETAANVEDNILYDLTIHSEWPQEPEITNKVPKEKLQVSLAGRVKSTAYISTWTVLRTLGVQPSTTSPCTLPAELVRLVSGEMSWHFAVTRDGQNVAILQDQTLEIRAARDEYASVVSKCNVGRDIYPQWRQVAWSLDGDMLAVSNSNGKVQVYDIMGTPICTLPNVAGAIPTIPVDLSNAVVSLIFREYKFDGDWSAELIVINYQGGLRSYAINRDGEYKLCHEFVFSEHYPRGVSAAVYHQGHSLLLLGGCADLDAADPEKKNVNAAMQQGITAWRVLSDVPYYKLVTDYEQDLLMGQKKGIFKRLRQLYPSWQTAFQEGIYKLRISTKGDQLAAIHYSGAYSMWDLPSLRLRHYWPLEQQPDYDIVNAEIAENPKKRKVMKEHLTAFSLVDSNWWSNESVILARGNGAVTVSSAETLANLLGKSPEWFEPCPRVTPAVEGGFLGLECECKYSSLKRRHAEEEQQEAEYDDSDEEQEAMVTRARRYTRQVMYYVTDSETFQPPRKKPKLVTRTYRLICLKSTTPEELYSRKIDSEEYGEALLLAKTYGLDSDLVYQRQWRKTPVSVASIQDYLSKISKRSWVLHECLERVPENIDAMRELLQYGLRGTDLEALIAIGKGEDGGRFILCDAEEAYEQSLDSYDPEAETDSKEKEADRRETLLKEVDFASLTLEQRVLCMSRMKLLQYHYRLATYEEILGGLHHAEERFDPKFFEKFRADNMVAIATDYARNGDAVALDILLTYHTDELAKDRLAILANFPETMSPDDYKFLLPVVESRQVVPLDKHMWRDPDWCELPKCREAVETDHEDPGAFLYEENPDYENFRETKPSEKLVGKWYGVRAREVERLSRNVDYASLLIAIAMENNVKGLRKLKDDLETMETVVYQCYVDDNFTFEEFEKMSDIDKLKFMMSKSNNEMYPKNIHRWLVPFLDSCESREKGSYNRLLCEYLVGMAEEDLTRCRKVFEASKSSVANPVIKESKEALSLALDCVYACENDNQLGNAFGIVACVPQREYGVSGQENEALFDKVDELESFLGAAEILENNGLPQTISCIKDSRNDQEKTIQLFRKLTRTAGRKTPPLGETAWRNLLCNLLDLREKVYRCVPSNTCYEIFVESLLCSGRKVNIKLASDFIECKKEQHDVPLTHKVQFHQAIPLILAAAREYFDSSGNLTDPCMELAKDVLGLIKQEQPEITEELDLIESLTLLDGFAVQMLPVQVRMCEDRLDLIVKALDAKPVTYRNSQRLLKLAKLIRVCGKDSKEREGVVLQLVAQYALKSSDFKVAQDCCKRMIELGYSPSWLECKMLAEEESFSDIHAKADLLCFAVTHCSAEMIEPILRAKCLLETKILYDRIHRQVEDRDSASPIENPISAKGALHHTKEILSSTTKTTKAMLSTVTDKKWWKKTLKSLNRDRHCSTNSYEAQDEDNDDFERQGIHPFYESVIPEAFLHTAEADYCNVRLPRLHAGSLDLSEAVLRARKLEQTVTAGESEGPPDEVLVQLAQDSLAKDTLLGMAYLLSLPKALSAEQCLSKNPHTAISLQIAAYYYALQIYTRIMPVTQTDKHPVYAADPTDVINTVASKITELPESKWPDSVRDLVPQLKKYQELLLDYTQAKVLQGLGRGVDVGRFTKDNDYKRETILGLAMTSEPSVFDIAVGLAHRYKLSLWEVYMTHLEYLFDSCERTEDIEQRVRELTILGTLHEKPTEFRERMFKYVYPSLDGTGHGRLVYFYSLLGNIPLERDHVTADEHVKLLRKIKTSAPGLDYRKLMSGEHRPLDVIRPVLNTGNVHVISKLSAKIPDSKGGFLDPSLVFCAWATNVFWKGETAKQTPPQTEAEWIHRYEQCGDYIQKMLPSHFLDFVDGIVFTRDAIDKLGYECRSNILKRSLKFSRSQPGKKKKMDDAGCDIKWPQAADNLQQWCNHLEKSNCATMQLFRDSGEEDLLKYAEKFDLSKNEKPKMQSLLMEVLVDGQLPDVVQQILDVNPLNGWTPRTALIEAMQLCISTLGNPVDKPDIFGKRDAIEILRALVQVTSEHKKRGGDLIGLEDVMSQVRPFCADGTKPVQDRLDALQIVERSFELSGEDLSLLTLYRTDAIVKTTWPNVEISQEQVKTPNGRAQLFKNLLMDSQSLDHYLSLAKLLRVWPADENKESKDPTKNPWYQLFSGLVRLSKTEAELHIIQILTDQQNSQPLPQQVVQALFDLLKDQELPFCAIKCLLISDYVELHEQAISELKAHEEAEDDEELPLLVLQRHLVARLVESAYYPKLVSYIIAQQEERDEGMYYFNPKEIANELVEAGYVAQAGSLLAQTKGLNPALRTFNTAMNIVSSWF